MRDEKRDFINEQADETRDERGLYCMTQIANNPDPLHLLAASHDWDDLAEEPAQILTDALEAEDAADQGDYARAREAANLFIDEAIAEYTPLDEFAQEGIERALGIEAENTGGGVMCFIFHKEGDPVEKSLIFGWANGGLGFQVYDDKSGDEGETGELPAGSATDAQVRFIKETAARLGYTIPDACADGCPRGCPHDAPAMPGPVAPPTPYTVKRERGAAVVYDANGGAMTGPINGKAALLLAAGPDMAEALKTAEKIIKTARQYFPKSIKNGDRFALELAAAEIGKALHRAQEAR